MIKGLLNVYPRNTTKQPMRNDGKKRSTKQQRRELYSVTKRRSVPLRNFANVTTELQKGRSTSRKGGGDDATNG